MHQIGKVILKLSPFVCALSHLLVALLSFLSLGAAMVAGELLSLRAATVAGEVYVHVA